MPEPAQRIGFLGRIENLEIKTAMAAAKVIVNSRTGSVVMNRAVELDNFAVAHGNLSVAISGDAGGAVDIKQEGGGLANVKASPKLADVLQAIKSAGALRAELEII
jgi:flagellar P-ring protein precursor FlgI